MDRLIAKGTNKERERGEKERWGDRERDDSNNHPHSLYQIGA